MGAGDAAESTARHLAVNGHHRRRPVATLGHRSAPGASARSAGHRSEDSPRPMGTTYASHRFRRPVQLHCCRCLATASAGYVRARRGVRSSVKVVQCVLVIINCPYAVSEPEYTGRGGAAPSIAGDPACSACPPPRLISPTTPGYTLAGVTHPECSIGIFLFSTSSTNSAASQATASAA